MDYKNGRFLIGINRIRLEFKDNGRRRKGIPMVVLIESDWNLKTMTAHRRAWNSRVLIESDWNLKVIVQCSENERLTY